MGHVCIKLEHSKIELGADKMECTIIGTLAETQLVADKLIEVICC